MVWNFEMSDKWFNQDGIIPTHRQYQIKTVSLIKTSTSVNQLHHAVMLVHINHKK